MDQTYDVIILGTGMTECVLSGLLAVSGKKVLHIDRNKYYGGDCASLPLETLYNHFDKKMPPFTAGWKSHEFNVDLTPKVLMGCGNLVKILRKTVADRYDMEFLVIDGSFILKDKKTHKVPATETEALTSSLMGILEKRRAAKLLAFVGSYKEKDPSTHKGLDLHKMTFGELCKKYGVDHNTIFFLVTCVALEMDDACLGRPAIETVRKLQLYEESAACFGRSPYLYPCYGLSDIPQAFARLCAVHEGTYMLDKPVTRIVYDEAGKFKGVESQGEVATAKFVIGDPTYFPDRVRPTGKIARAICLMQRPIPSIKDGAQSCQLIVPGKELGRQSDMYILMLSSVHKVCVPGLYLAIVSALMENTEDPMETLRPGIAMLGPIMDSFVSVYPQYEPLDDGRGNGVFISKSLDATSHFETCCDDIMDLWHRITGTPLDPDNCVAPRVDEDK